MTERPDIRVSSTLRARRLRFDSAPEVEVRIHPGGESRSRRSGFPKPVEPGVEYTDIRIDYGLTATANEADNES